MFFVLSKLLDYALLPLLWITIVLVYAIFTKSQRRRKKSLIAGVVMLFFFGNGFIINEAIYLWQKQPVLITSLPQYESAILLTGIVPYEERALPDRVHIGLGADRLIHTVQLYKANKVRKILISGGSGTLVGDKSSEAIKLKNVLLFCGVAEKDIMLESLSKNTHESSVFTNKLVDSLHIRSKLLLITSASHMRRAKACFDKAGVNTDIFPVDYAPHGEFYLEQFIPTDSAIVSWTALLREMVGYVVYRVMGYC